MMIFSLCRKTSVLEVIGNYRGAMGGASRWPGSIPPLLSGLYTYYIPAAN